MLSIKIKILYIVLITIIVGIQSLQELATDNSIRTAETIIRSTVNKLFTIFKIQDSNQQHKLKQLFAIYDFFVSITLQDCDNLNQIAKLSRVNDIDNMQHLIMQINEVLNESDKCSETNGSDIFVANHIERFIGKLKYLKGKYDANMKNIINAQILSYLNDNRIDMRNVTEVNNSLEIKAGTEEETVNDTISNFDEYWRPSGRRIYKGIRTKIKHFPFMASVQFFKKFQCAGSIIKNDLVITSASCLQLSWNNRFFRENPAFLSVQIGSDFYEHGGENIDVQEIYFHPRYDPKTLRHNLALMRLSRRISFKKKHRRVRKIDIDRTQNPLSGYDYITVVGWGARDSSNIVYNVLQNRLAYADLDFYPLDECREHYTRQFVSRQNFCAGFFSKGGGACNRDAGGPGIIGYKLMGVISFGAPICGSPDKPTVFTKLGYYTDWIDNIMEQDVPSVKKRTTRQLSEMMFTLKEITRTKEVRFTPVVPTKPTLPMYIDDLRMLRKESSNDISFSKEIGELYVHNISELNENKQKPLDTEVTTNKDQSRHKIKPASATKNEYRQQESNKDESIYDSSGMSIELIRNISTKATIKTTKQLYNKVYDSTSIETDSEMVNDPPADIIDESPEQQLKKDDSIYNSTESDPESLEKLHTETKIKLPQRQVNGDDNFNKVSTKTVHSTNTQSRNKFTLLELRERKSNNVKNKSKQQMIENVKKQKIRNFKAPVKQNIKTIISATTIVSLNKSTVQTEHKLNRLFNEDGSNNESLETEIGSVNSHLKEVKNKLTEQQLNISISDDVIKRYVKQILDITDNKKKESTPKVIVMSRTTTTAINIALSNKPTQSTENILKQQQFNKDKMIRMMIKDESMETATESVIKYPSTLKKITQQQFNVGISDELIKKYILQYLKEKGFTRNNQVNSTLTNTVSTNRPNAKLRNKLKQKPFIGDNKEIVETHEGSVNDELTHQKFNVGRSHGVMNMNKKHMLQTSQNKGKGTIKKSQVKPKSKTSTTTTTLGILNKSTSYAKNKLKQPQLDTDAESSDKLKQQRFNLGARHSRLMENDLESVQPMSNLKEGVNVREIKDDIMTLIDNLDIDQLLDEVDYRKEESAVTGESNDRKIDTINLKQWNSLKILFSSKEDETRMSIPAESFNNLSLTNPPESIEYSKIPKSILFDLVSLAVEEEIKRKTGANKAIRNGRHYVI